MPLIAAPLLAAASCALYGVLALAGDLRLHMGLYLALHAALLLLYAIAARLVWAQPLAQPPPGPAVILAAALLFRAIMLPAVPSLSDDIYRYIWEGTVQLHGINPYLQAPDDPDLAPLRDPLWERINYKEMPAIYPPLAQWASALAALAGRSTTIAKLPFVLADLLLCVALARLLRARGEPEARALLYAWNPLVVVEVAGSGHNDPLAILMVVVAVVAIIGKRGAASMIALGAGALAKLFPLALVPLFFRRVKTAWLLVPPLIVAAGYLPYAGAGLFHSGREYAERWRGHESLFALIEAALGATGVSGPLKTFFDDHGWPSLYTQPHMLARAVAALVSLGVLVALAHRAAQGRIELVDAIAGFTGTVLLVSPVLHPWYLLWMLPWMALRPSPAWLMLAGVAPAFYAGLSGWVAASVYALFFSLLVVDLARPSWRARL